MNKKFDFLQQKIIKSFLFTSFLKCDELVCNFTDLDDQELVGNFSILWPEDLQRPRCQDHPRL